MIAVMISIGVLSIVCAIAHLMTISREIMAEPPPAPPAPKRPIPLHCDCRMCKLRVELWYPEMFEAPPSRVRAYVTA